MAEGADQAPGERQQQPGDEQDDDDAPDARQRERRLVIQAVEVLKELF